MPLDKDKNCIYECNKGIKCECSDCNICEHNPKKRMGAHMTIGDLIKNKDYDYVSYRLTLPDGSDTFAGCFASKAGEILSLDGDTYSKDEEVLSYKEWDTPEEGIKNGLTVVVKADYILTRRVKE